MKAILEKQTVPLAMDDDGVLRVGGTRVTLDTVVAAFEAGSTCEEIVQQYSSLRLADIYVVVGYYLTHRSELQEYLDRRAAQRDESRATTPLAPRDSNAAIRDRLLGRRSPGG